MSATDSAFRLGFGSIDARAGVIVERDGRHALARDLVSDGAAVPHTVLDVLMDWDRWRGPLVQAARRLSGDVGDVGDEAVAWEVPVPAPKLICIGTNYHDHVEEMGGTPPKLPYSFFKPVSTGLVATGTDVVLPAMARFVDWEAELAFIVGTRTRHAALDTAHAAVGAYVALNDLSARDWIESRPEVGIDWVLQKGHDGFAPIGGLVTPAEFVTDPQSLPIRCWVNGVLKQDSNTARMIFGVSELIVHLSAIMTLEPGDIVSTGTPAGVGFAAHPRELLRAGDRVRVEVEGVGSVETTMVAPRDASTVDSPETLPSPLPERSPSR